MKYKVLMTAELIKSEFENLKEYITVDYAGYAIDRNVMPQAELKEKIKDYDILICEYDTIDSNILSNAKNLKLIICCRGGVGSVIDLDYCKKHNINVCNNAGRNASSVGEMVLGYMIDLSRNISIANLLIHNKIITSNISTMPEEYEDTVWGIDNNSPFIKFRGNNLKYMTLGLVGYGHVGYEVAKLAIAMGMNVIAYDPYFNSHGLNVKQTELWELLKKSDIVSVHCPATPENKGMFNKSLFEKMKEGAYFINTSRGELIVEEDMINALKTKKLAGAAMDVFMKEPLPDDSPLLDCDNLIMTPHIAGSSYDVQLCGTKLTKEALKSWLEGKKPKYAVVWSE